MMIYTHNVAHAKVIGIGSGRQSDDTVTMSTFCSRTVRLGSTVPYVVERIVAQGQALNKDRVFIPTSTCVRPVCSTVPEQMCATGFQSKELIVNAQLLLGDVDQYPLIDVTIDGADECVQALRSSHLSLC